MRASTLFALTIAVLIGLGVAIAAKVTGLFNPRTEAPPKTQAINVLAAGRNLFSGDMIDATTVYVRPLKPEEFAHYQQHRDQYLPPLPAAVYLRIAGKNIEADQPILKEALKELVKPEPLNTRLLGPMRAVNVTVTKERAAGGLIQVGEWVDVFLTCTVENNAGATTARTACLAPRVRVIAKRNTLWPIFASIPDDKPFQYTIEVNPYRAALLEYARAKGEVTLVLLPGSDQRELESRREKVFHQAKIKPVHFLEPGTQEAEEEDGRVESFLHGETAVGNNDLMRIFGIQTPPPPEVPAAKKAPPSVEQYVGIQRQDPARFSPSGTPLEVERYRPVAAARPKTAATQAPSFQFTSPSAKECKKCKKKKKAPPPEEPTP